jgi:hypothetical protein
VTRVMQKRASVLLCAAAGAAGLLALAACGSSASSGAATSAASASSSSTSTVAASPSPSWTGAPITAAEAAAVRDRALGYWAAYNAYDPNKVISYLAGSIKAAKAEVVRSEVGRIKTFGVQLGVSQKTPPELTGADQAQMYLKMKTPTGMRTVLMKFEKQGGLWMVTYSEEVK